MKKAILAVVRLCFCAASFAASTITTRVEDPKAIYLDAPATAGDNSAALQAAIDKTSGTGREGIVFVQLLCIGFERVRRRIWKAQRSVPSAADAVRREGDFLASEFGAEAKYGNHGETNQRWTEEQQAYVIEHQFAMMRKIPNLRGLTPWILIDFRSTTRNIPKLQDGYNRKGLISEKGERKQAFELFQKAYKDHSLGKPE